MVAGGDPTTGSAGYGSGTGELVGITGTLDLEIVEGTHRYFLDYDLPGKD